MADDSTEDLLEKAKEGITSSCSSAWIFPGCSCLLMLLFIILGVAAFAATFAKHQGEESGLEGGTGTGCRIEGPNISQATRQVTRMFSTTAYYRPLPGQKKYEQGSYEAELRMEGTNTTASGFQPEIGAIAAPPSYPFGTVIDLPGYGRGVVLDRGCAIQEAGVPSKCPGLARVTTRYDHLDLFVGEGDEGREAMNAWNGKEVQGTVYYFDGIPWSQLKSQIKTVCQNTGGESKITGATAYPVKPPITGIGNSLHYCTAHRKDGCGVAGHRKAHQSNNAIGDAVDIQSGSGDRTIFAVFSGVVSSSGQRVILKSNSDPNVFAVYYHVSATKTGQVNAGDPIGTYSAIVGHLHFEIWLNNNTSIQGDPSRLNGCQQDCGSSNQHDYNKSIWENMAKFLGLKPYP